MLPISTNPPYLQSSVFDAQANTLDCSICRPAISSTLAPLPAELYIISSQRLIQASRAAPFARLSSSMSNHSWCSLRVMPLRWLPVARRQHAEVAGDDHRVDGVPGHGAVSARLPVVGVLRFLQRLSRENAPHGAAIQPFGAAGRRLVREWHPLKLVWERY